MSSSIPLDPTVPSTRRRPRLGIAARLGIFAGAAGIALLSVGAASASATPVRSGHVVRTLHARPHRVVRTRYIVRRRSTLRSVSAPAVVSSSGLGGVWACIRQHESGGNYAINTGNGYYGAYQFSLSTWRSVGGSGLPSQASPAEQDMRAQILQSRSGWSPWPQTSRMCGV
jgi:hypothetical protein